MRNQLDIWDLEGGIEGVIYWARGELDEEPVSVMGLRHGEVGIGTKDGMKFLSLDAALELAKHLQLAVQAVREEVSHD